VSYTYLLTYELDEIQLPAAVMSHDLTCLGLVDPMFPMFPKVFVLRPASAEAHACIKCTVLCNEAVQRPKLRAAYILWDNLMMTSLHSYVAFVFVRVLPKKDDEDCANYLIGYGHAKV
jgi:hypothetical protein